MEVTLAVPTATGADDPIGGTAFSEFIDRVDVVRCEKDTSSRSTDTTCQGNVSMRLDGVGFPSRPRDLVATSNVDTDIGRFLQVGRLGNLNCLKYFRIEGPDQVQQFCLSVEDIPTDAKFRNREALVQKSFGAH